MACPEFCRQVIGKQNMFRCNWFGQIYTTACTPSVTMMRKKGSIKTIMHEQKNVTSMSCILLHKHKTAQTAFCSALLHCTLLLPLSVSLLWATIVTHCDQIKPNYTNKKGHVVIRNWNQKSEYIYVCLTMASADFLINHNCGKIKKRLNKLKKYLILG